MFLVPVQVRVCSPYALAFEAFFLECIWQHEYVYVYGLQLFALMLELSVLNIRGIPQYARCLPLVCLSYASFVWCSHASHSCANAACLGVCP